MPDRSACHVRAAACATFLFPLCIVCNSEGGGEKGKGHIFLSFECPAFFSLCGSAPLGIREMQNTTEKGGGGGKKNLAKRGMRGNLGTV